MSKVITVVRRNGETHEVIVDKDFELDSKLFIRGGKGNTYAAFTMGGKIISLHRFIIGVHYGDPKLKVDHINGNSLDNRKENLRVCTNQKNGQNRRSKGYTWDKRKKKWKAAIKINGRSKHLGLFDTPEEAQQVYRKAHVEAFGEFSPYYNYYHSNNMEVN